MNYRTRILGYDITFSKPSSCPICEKQQQLDILERVIDTQDGLLKYIVIFKCSSCHEISIAEFVIGKETELKEIEFSSSKNPIEAVKILGK